MHHFLTRYLQWFVLCINDVRKCRADMAQFGYARVSTDGIL